VGIGRATLVVETANFRGGDTAYPATAAALPFSGAMRLSERFTRVTENTINFKAIDNRKTPTFARRRSTS
jgi:predicted hotdog family 3-hydroxylacyl-ACP dehydratase